MMTESVALAVYVPEGKLWRLLVVTDGSMWMEDRILQSYRNAGTRMFWKWIYYPAEFQLLVDKDFLLGD